jgi:hypothetical protein
MALTQSFIDSHDNRVATKYKKLAKFDKQNKVNLIALALDIFTCKARIYWHARMELIE